MDEDMMDLLALYALGALSVEERDQVERYLEANPQARAELGELLQAASALSHVGPAVQPAEGSWKALAQRIRANRPDGPRRARFRLEALGGTWLRRGAAVASLAVGLVSLGAVLLTRGELGQLRAQNAELQRQLASHEQLLRLIGGPELVTVEVRGTEAQPLAHGRLYSEPGRELGVLLVTGLPPLPEGSAYQAWLMRGETPVPAGVFRASPEGLGTLTLQAEGLLGEYDALAVSVEPELGSLLPTGPVVLLGPLTP